MKLDDLIETAQLAHLSLDDAELERAFSAFDQMLSFFAAMQEADTDRAAFKTAVTELSGGRNSAGSGHFRPDDADNCLYRPQTAGSSTIEDMLGNAGDRNGRFIVVPNVL